MRVASKLWILGFMVTACGGSPAPLWLPQQVDTSTAQGDAQAMMNSSPGTDSDAGSAAPPMPSAEPSATAPTRSPQDHDAGASTAPQSTPSATPPSSPQSGTVVVDCDLGGGAEYVCYHPTSGAPNVVTAPATIITFALTATGPIENDAWCGAGDAGTWANVCPSGAACEVAGLPFGTNAMGHCR